MGADKGEFETLFKEQMIRCRSRSPFSSITGCGDQFKNPTDLIKNARCVTHFDPNSMPLVAPRMDDLNQLAPTNSWVVDFLMHGKKKYLLEDNGINATKAYKLITGFIDACNMLVAVLQMIAPEKDIVLETLRELASEMDRLN